MNEELLAIGGFFFTVIVVTLGYPLVRALVRRQERTPIVPPSNPEVEARLARIEHAIEAVAVEVERISEGQRFVTRLLAERDRDRAPAQLPPERHESP